MTTYNADNRPLAATIGFFDGVHLGHRYLIEQLTRQAEQRDMATAVVTFANHPRSVVGCDYLPELLLSAEEKTKRLEACGLDKVVVLTFTPELAAMSAESFMTFLHERYGVGLLMIGHDHHFGSRRNETFEDYRRYGERLGVEVVRALPLLQDELAVSSSRVRRALQNGEVTEAASLLGYPYSIAGVVKHGDQIGRTIGFPTANLRLTEAHRIIPTEGVYAVRVTMPYGGAQLGGVLYIGYRPTVEGHELRIEVHIIGYEGELYGERLTLELVARLGDSLRYSSTEALSEGVARFCLAAKEHLETYAGRTHDSATDD